MPSHPATNLRLNSAHPSGQLSLVFDRNSPPTTPFPERASQYPELRYMGSKHRLLRWLHSILRDLPFETAAAPFLGSGCVAYLLKSMGKRVIASDFLNFPTVLAQATIANNRQHIDGLALKQLLAAPPSGSPDFIQRTFSGIFFNQEGLRFLDRVSANLQTL